MRRPPALGPLLLAGVVVAGTLGATAALAAESPSPGTSAELGEPVSGLASASMVPALPPLPNPSATVTREGVLRALAPALADPALAPPIGLVVSDPATGDVVLDLAAGTPLVPASTVKLATATAVLESLGAGHRVSTTVVAPDPGTVVLVGGGDPLLTAEPQPELYGASLRQLAAVSAAELKAAGSVEVAVAVDDSLFSPPTLGPGWEAEDVDLCLVTPISALRVFQVEPAVECVPDVDPAVTAGRVFAGLLADYGISVVGDVARQEVGEAARTLAAVESQPAAALVEQMLTDSDNVSAEMLGHLVGLAESGEASFAAGARATADILTGLGLPTAGLTLVDASGLSVDDRMAPATAVALLDAALGNQESALWPIMSGLPVAGSTGTLADRFDTPETAAGRGDVRGKTGTLTGVSALSGQVVTADGQLLTFSIITNGADDILAARQALDTATSALAQCGCSGGAA
ncbi:MAG: D-alanyl-D-alanine carboxypeptidase/D-alanyl-D-alanine-endopeptidase [Actinobacteria bacterium]|nr:D-alanyl-D-alanine carboxypeptidase/D-alanyl-D-alanine-endopeptidase [Actinomycetota bacterium]MCB9411365.1 D-alanyl-D-alanine carboxypeptidase/D-alanyl-D-alanine-endopeptidase [Actinomycetota bacterium]